MKYAAAWEELKQELGRMAMFDVGTSPEDMLNLIDELETEYE